MSQLPMVTAIIPCHNHARWVGGAIRSIVSQNYPNVRVVVVDDGSTDGSTEAVLSLMEVTGAGNDGVNPFSASGFVGAVPLTLIRFDQAGGPSHARNAGIKACWQGTDLFALLDADDLYEQGKIALSVEKWLEAPDHIAVVYSDFETWNEKTGLRIRQYKEPYSRERLIQECVVNCDSLVSRLAFEQCGLFDEEMRVAEDYDLWMRMSEKFVLVHLPTNLLTIRVGDHSSTANVASQVWQANWRRVMAKTQARMDACKTR